LQFAALTQLERDHRCLSQLHACGQTVDWTEQWAAVTPCISRRARCTYLRGQSVTGVSATPAACI